MKSAFTFAAKALTFAVLMLSAVPAVRAETPAAVLPPVVTLPEDIKWFPMIPEMGNAGPAMAVVFGEPGVLGKPFGGLFRVPAGGLSPLHTHTSEYWAVMLDGTESGRVLTEDAPVAVPAGSFWFQPKEAVHVNECLSDAPCTFFVYFPDGMDYLPAEH